MEPITTGMQGAAVEDVQSRLLQLGYTIDADEVADKRFGTTTEQAVGTFRLDSGLAAGCSVDIPCWSALVDACTSWATAPFTCACPISMAQM